MKEGDSSTERGALLENLVKRILISRQYEHVRTTVRVTGCELDVIAQDSQTGSKVLVECKAYRDKQISADVLTKLTGNVIFELISGEKVTPPLHCGLLDGVGRARDLAAGRVREATVRVDDLPSVRRIWFVNALRGLLPAALPHS